MLKIVSFSDWRTQKIEYILKFIRNLKPKPDFILYAGDDTRRFIEADHETLNLIRGFSYKFKAKFEENFVKQTKRKKRAKIPLKSYSLKPFDTQLVINYLYYNYSEINHFFENLDLDYFAIKKIQNQVKKELAKFQMIQKEEQNYRFFYPKNENKIRESIDYKEKTFKKKFPKTIKILEMLSIKNLWESIDYSEEEIYISFAIKNENFNFTLESRPYLILSINQGHSFSLIRWIDKELSSNSLEEFSKIIGENFIIEQSLHFTNVREPISTDKPIIIKVGLDNYYWKVKLVLKNNVKSKMIKRNYFEELAQMSNIGLFAIIGNDCYKWEKNLIFGKKVKDLHNTIFEHKKTILFGIEGAESIMDDEERLVHETIPVRDIGIVIYPKQAYQRFLEKIQSKKYKNFKKIIIAHNPPYKCLDHARRFGQHFIGSKSLRKAIENDSNISLVVCGHVHLFGGNHERLNNALVVNCASHDDLGALGNVAVIEYDEALGDVINIEWHELGSNLQRVWGIGYKYAQILEESGIEKIEQILTISPEDPIVEKIGKRRIKKFQTQSKAILENKAYYTNAKISTSKDINEGIIIDIETDLNQEQIWAVVLKNGDVIKQYFLDNPENEEEEKQFLSEMLNEIKRIHDEKKNIKLFCYSMTNFDFRVLEKRLDKFELDTKLFVSIPKIDLFNEFKKKVYLPAEHYDLKTVSNYFNYERKADLPEKYNGLMASTNYYKTFGHNKSVSSVEKEEKKHELMAYNLDDVLMIPHIWNEIEGKG